MRNKWSNRLYQIIDKMVLEVPRRLPDIGSKLPNYALIQRL